MSSNIKGTVLVADDQERNVQVVGSTLANAGYEVMVASSGEQALARVEARQPDLILLDVLMPGMDGFEVCRKLKESTDTEDIPVIFLSAADDTEMIVRALDAGGVDYVTKPFNKSELLARVRTQVELKRSRNECDELLKQREEFIEMMAHDLKNPLGGAHFSCQMLAEVGDDIKGKSRKLLATACDGIARSLTLIERFLTDAHSARADIEFALEPIDLTECVDCCVERYHQQAARKGIEILWESPSSGVLVEGDVEGIGRILDNLLSNALKFSPEGRQVKVFVNSEESSVVVRDEGPGFTEEDKGHLFESFRRLSAKPTAGEPSTGLGLSIAHRFAKAMGGTLELDGSHRSGASFVLKFNPAS